MLTKNQSCGLEGKKDQHAMLDLEIKERLRHITNKILVMSGKGGVGKSSVAAYRSLRLQGWGFLCPS